MKRRALHTNPIYLWLMNNITYEQKYIVAGAIRGIGYFILWFTLFFLVWNKSSLLNQKISDEQQGEKFVESMEKIAFEEIPKQMGEPMSRSAAATLLVQEIEKLGDHSVQKSDSVDFRYLILESTLKRIRESQQFFNRTMNLLDQGVMNEGIKTDLMSTIILLKRNSEVIFRDLNRVRNSFRDKELRIALNQYIVSVEEAIRAIDQRYLAGNEDVAYIDRTAFTENGFILWGEISQSLDKILEAKSESLWSSMLYVFFTAAVLTLLGSYLGVHFVYEAIKCFRDLDHGTRKLTTGDLSVRVPVIYQEEIGKATEAFNQMADHLEKLIGQHRNLFHATQRVVKGDFSARVTVPEKADEEMREVVLSFNRMLQTFEEIVKQLKRLGVNLTSSADEIADASKKQEVMIVDQGAATREISITSRQISTTAKDFAGTINDVSQVAERTANLASVGQDSLVKMEEIMERMVGASSAIAKKLAILSEKAGNITKVITTITDVSRQTNMLSLNAAIEAEKTGKFSREFSVIAREIRRLADQTAIASLDIEKIVTEIIDAVSTCVSGVEDFAVEISEGVKQVSLVGEHLGQIIVQVQALAYRFELVNDGMQQQSKSAEKITESMAFLSKTSSETVESINQFGHTIEKLINASNRLSETIDEIKAN